MREEIASNERGEGMRPPTNRSRGKHGEWDQREDAVLRDLTQRLGDTDWCVIASVMKDLGFWRSPRQCRERYKNHVRPGFRLGAYSAYARARFPCLCE